MSADGAGVFGAELFEAEPFVVGPDGERMTRDDLPDAATSRWVPRRKARVVAAVEGGLVSRDWALEHYRLTDEEFDGWRAAMTRHGMRGLCVTKLGRGRHGERTGRH